MMMADNIYRLESGEDVVCLEVVRSLPGKRLVFLGEYAGEKVFVKLFLDLKKSEKHWRRELDGLDAFKKCKIPTAELLYFGKTSGQSVPVIILSKLTDVTSVKQAWDQADTDLKKQIIKRMILLLARQHQAGLCQTDLHLDNFMLSDQEIFSLDGAGVKLFANGVSQDSRLENLGLFIAQLAPEWESHVSDIYHIYATECGWRHGPGSEVLLEKVRRAREGRWREFRGKLFRNCTAFTFTKYQDGFQVVANEYASRELHELLQDPDASFPGEGQAIKNGNTCTVWSASMGGLCVVLKRYNIKDVWHGIKLRFLPGRGERSWVNGHRLSFYGIATPKPIALLKRKIKYFPISYLITEQIEAVSARDWFNDASLSAEEKELMAGNVVKILGILQQQKISHGDLKASNILISQAGPTLIDLDAMVQHKDATKFEKAWSKDIRRFLENWEDDKRLFGMFVKSMKSGGIDTTGAT